MKPSRFLQLILALPLAPPTTAQKKSAANDSPAAVTGASMLPFWTGAPDAAAFDRAMDARLAHARQQEQNERKEAARFHSAIIQDAADNHADGHSNGE